MVNEPQRRIDKIKYNIIIFLTASVFLVLAATFFLTNLFVNLNKSWLLEKTQQGLINFVVILVEDEFKSSDFFKQNFINNGEKFTNFFTKVLKNPELRYVNIFNLEGEAMSSNPKYEFSDISKRRVSRVLGGETIIRESVEEGESLVEIYIPLKNEDGIIYGAIEVYHKLNIFNTHLNQTIDVTRVSLLLSFSFITIFIIFWSYFFYKKIKLQNDKLIESEISLRKNIELKKLFISIINHDLKNPLTIIRFAVSNLKENITKKSQVRDLNEIDKTVLTILHMVDDARVLSKLEDTEYSEKKKKIDLVFFLQEIVNDFSKRYYQNKTVKIDYIHTVKKCNIKVLSVLNDAFINIIDNAIKYNGQNIHIIIELFDRDDSCFITFTDNGIGIPDSNKKDVFLRYKRLNKNDAEGTGIGLAIVKNVVELHEGKVWIEDNPNGKGSAFKIELPKK